MLCSRQSVQTRWKILVFFAVLPFLAGSIDPPLACLESWSCFQGERLSSAAGNVYASYRGVPYVQPPLGVLRWDPLNLNVEAILEGSFHQNHCTLRKERGTCLVIQMPAALNWREVVTCTRRIVSRWTYICAKEQNSSGASDGLDTRLQQIHRSGTTTLQGQVLSSFMKPILNSKCPN